MHSGDVDGLDHVAVADAVLKRKRSYWKTRSNLLLDTITYRISGHSTSDASSYRTKEIEEWRKNDSIDDFSKYLIENAILKESDIEALQKECSHSTIYEAVKRYER